MTFAMEGDLESHIQRRHTPQQDTVAPPVYSSQNHSLALILEEQIDMAQTLKQFKESVNAQLSTIRNDHEELRDDIKKHFEENVLSRSSSLGQFKTLQANIDHQTRTISELITSFASKSMCESGTTSAASSSSVPLSSTPSPPPMFPRTSLETPASTQNVRKANSNSVPPDHPRKPSVPAPSSTPPANVHLAKSDRLQTSERQKVLFIADSIGSSADIRHLEEGTNTLIYTEKAFGAEYKADAYRPNDNFIYVARNAPRKRNYTYSLSSD